MPPNRTLDQFFERVNQIQPISWKHHPPDRILRDFATDQLTTTWVPSKEHFEKILKEQLEIWTATDVRAHVLTCKVCSERIGRLRRSTGTFIVWLDELSKRVPNWFFEPAVFRTHGAAYIAATIALFVFPIAFVGGTTASPAPLSLLSQFFQGFNWVGIVLLVVWAGWSVVAFLHFLLLRHKSLW